MTHCLNKEIRLKLLYPAFQIVKELQTGFGRTRTALLLKPEWRGEYRDRTGDLLVANQTLSQLS
jgi:hypothetical protein